MRSNVENGFTYPGHMVTPLYIVVTILVSQIVMYLDQARIFSYGVVPIFVLASYAKESGMKFSGNKTLSFLMGLAATICWIFIVSWMVINDYIPPVSVFGTR